MAEDTSSPSVTRNQVAVVIPARYQSSRFPGKPLAHLRGKPIIQHVYDQVHAAQGVTRIVVATDDRRIYDVVRNFGGEAVLTEATLRTGSDRVAALVPHVSADVYVNLQGDEIPLAPALLEDLLAPFLASQAAVGTLKRALTDPRELHDPNVVKVVTNRQGKALYFSRSSIPYRRDRRHDDGRPEPGMYWKHLGLYAYTREALAIFAALPTGELEDSEQLEQLRLLEAGVDLQVWETKQGSLRIDTPEDLARAEQMLTRGEPAWLSSSS